MRNMLLLGALALAGASPAYGQASAMEPGSSWARARACVERPERLACWREVAARWSSRPPIPEAEPPAEAVSALPALDDLADAGDAFGGAIGEVADKLAAGLPATDALRGLEILPVQDPPFIANPLSDMSLVLGRLDAMAMLASIAHERGWVEAEAAILAAWEADLPEDSTTVLSSGAADLAESLARRGEGEAVERVLLTLEPEDAPEAVTALIRHGRLDAAARVADRMTVEAREAGLRRESEAMTQRYRTRTLPLLRAAMRAQFEGSVAHLPPSEREAAMVDLSQVLALDETAMLQAPADEDWFARARDEVTDARTALLRAADEAGRPDLARPLALALWEQPVERDWTGANTLVASLHYLVRPGATDGAARLIEAERRLRVRDRRSFPLKVLYDGWIRLGRRDQADALLGRWRAFAARQPNGETATIGGDLAAILIERDEVAVAERLPAFHPLMLLWHDAASGAGVARLEERIAGRDYETQRSMLMDCGGAAARGKLDMSETCLRRRMAYPSITPLEQWSIAQGLIDLGTGYARRGDRARAEALIAEGLGFSAGPPDEFMMSDFALVLALESVTGSTSSGQEASGGVAR